MVVAPFVTTFPLSVALLQVVTAYCAETVWTKAKSPAKKPKRVMILTINNFAEILIFLFIKLFLTPKLIISKLWHSPKT